MLIRPSQFIRERPIWRGKNPQLVDEIMGAVWKGRESSTVIKYCTVIRKFTDFCRENHHSLVLPFSSEIVAEHLLMISRSKNSKSSTDTAKSAIKWMNSFIPGINKWNDPLNDDFLGKVVSGIQRNSDSAKNQKRPFTGDIIR